MDSVQTKDDLNLKFYINSVKQGSIPWNFFAKLMSDLCQTLPQAKELNSILLDELKQFLDKSSPSFESLNLNDSGFDATEGTDQMSDTTDQQDEDLNDFETEDFKPPILDETSIVDQNVMKPETLRTPKLENGTYQCNKCEKTFPTMKKFQRHSMIHREKTFSCKHCDRKFNSKSKLDSHFQVVHLGIKPFKCLDCDQRFGLPSQLKSHRDFAHLGLKSSDCSFCDRKFEYPSALAKHEQMSHKKGLTQKKSYECTKCDKKFDWKTGLDRHLKTATHIGMLKCPFCRKVFKDPSERTKHVKDIHNESFSYTCHQCGWDYPTMKLLEDHTIKVHGIKKF